MNLSPPLRAATAALLIVAAALLLAACTKSERPTAGTVTVTVSDDERVNELKDHLEEAQDKNEDLQDKLDDAKDGDRTTTTGGDSGDSGSSGGSSLGNNDAEQDEKTFQDERAKALYKVRKTYKAMERCRRKTTFRTYVDENTNQIVCGIPQVRQAFPNLNKSLDLPHDAPGHLWLSGIATTAAEIDVMTNKLPDGKVVTFHMSVNHLDGHKQDCYPRHEAICAADVW